MNTNAVCPISDKVMNEYIARFNAFFTVVFLAVFLITGNLIPVIFLLFDFLLRAKLLTKYSPFAIISTQVISFFKIKNKPVNAGPKIFAVRFGVFFNISIFLLMILGFSTIALAVAVIFAFFAFLEAAFGFCVACKVYPYFYSLKAIMNTPIKS